MAALGTQVCCLQRRLREVCTDVFPFLAPPTLVSTPSTALEEKQVTTTSHGTLWHPAALAAHIYNISLIKASREIN